MLIAMDHGNKQIKTSHCPPFISGLTESSVKPFGSKILKYQDQFYMLSNERIPYMRDKTEDERFFALTLFGIAREVEKMGSFSDDVMRVKLAVGLPPAHYGAQYESFSQYFAGRDVVKFDYQARRYAIYIEDVRCYPQAYAAAVTKIKELMAYPRVLIVDIGGFTVDYLLMKNGEAELSVCNSMEKGVILLYNSILSRINSEFNVLLQESDIDAILRGQEDTYSPNIVLLVERMTQTYVNDLLNRLREKEQDISSGIVVFVGGGSILLRKQIEASGKIGKAIFVEDINANAKGYEFLYLSETMNR